MRTPSAVLGRVPAPQRVKLPLFKKFFLTRGSSLLSPTRICVFIGPFRLSTFLQSVGPLLVVIYPLFYFASLIPHPLRTPFPYNVSLFV
jgi:hypothetical protein